MDLLKVRRVSRNHDDSTALAKQDEKLDAYAAMHDHVIIGDAADPDVSGKTNPFERPELGRWLTDPVLIDQYDGLICSHLDRLGRSTKYISALIEWANEHDKRIIVTDLGGESVDFGSHIGKLIAYIISWLAEQELQLITKRSLDTRAFLLKNGHLVGPTMYGYRIVPDGDHKGLAIDPVQAGHIRRMVAMYLDGQSMSDIARANDRDGIPGPQGAPWIARTIGQMLRNTTLIGRRVDGDGKTLLKVEPILDRQTWEKVQALMDKKASRKGVAPKQSHWLTNVAECAKCGGVMYRVSGSYKLKDGTKRSKFYMRCTGTAEARSTCKNGFPLDELEERFDRMMSGALGRFKLYRNDVTPGRGYEEEIQEIERDIRELDLDDPSYDARLADLRAERSRLKLLPNTPAKVDRVWTGETIGEHWATLETDFDRRKFLVDEVGLKLPVLRGTTRDEDRAGPYTLYTPNGSSMLSGSLNEPFTDDEPELLI